MTKIKIRLSEDMKPDFMKYAVDRKSRQPLDRNMNYLTNEVLSRTFDFFVRHELTVHDNAQSYWYRDGERQDECLGYSGYSINERDDTDGIIDNLFHEVWCKAEWIARSRRDGYIDVCKQIIGVTEFNEICA